MSLTSMLYRAARLRVSGGTPSVQSESLIPLRDRMGKAILAAFQRSYEKHGIDYDPDTCYEAADEVIALLLGELTGDDVIAKFHPSIIGPAEFVFAGRERRVAARNAPNNSFLSRIDIRYEPGSGNPDDASVLLMFHRNDNELEDLIDITTPIAGRPGWRRDGEGREWYSAAWLND